MNLMADYPNDCEHEWTNEGGYVFCARCGGGRECDGWREACDKLAGRPGKSGGKLTLKVQPRAGQRK